MLFVGEKKNHLIKLQMKAANAELLGNAVSPRT